MKNETQGTAAATAAPTPKTVSANEALHLLHSGKTRKEINQHFGLTNAEGILLWQHPKLKGKKFTPPVNLTVIDDIPEKATASANSTASSEKVGDAPAAPATAPAAEVTPEVVQAEEIPAAQAEESLWDRK